MHAPTCMHRPAALLKFRQRSRKHSHPSRGRPSSTAVACAEDVGSTSTHDIPQAANCRAQIYCPAAAESRQHYTIRPAAAKPAQYYSTFWPSHLKLWIAVHTTTGEQYYSFIWPSRLQPWIAARTTNTTTREQPTHKLIS